MPQHVHAIVVTYHPQPEVLGNLRAIRPQVDRLIVVDNGSAPEGLEMLRAESAGQRFDLIENGRNLGIATALNVGVARAAQQGADWVLLFDQDSRATPAMVRGMIDNFLEREQQGQRVGLLVPAYRDLRSGVPIKPDLLADGSLETAITSGTLMRLQTMLEAGSFAEELFIDGVDLEYSLRLRGLGYTLQECSQAVLLHCPGEPQPQRQLGMRYSTTGYGPARRYYQARNRVWLMRRFGRRFPSYTLRLMATTLKDIVKIILHEQGATGKLRALAQGLLDGVRNRMGVLS